jgi:hypothetical protein
MKGMSKWHSRRDGLVRSTLASVILVPTVFLAGSGALQAVLDDVVSIAGGRRACGGCGGGLSQDGSRCQEGDESDKGLHLGCCVG